MPTLWRFLIRQYFSVLLLTLVAFIGILLVTRLDEIAHYAVLSGKPWQIFIFTLYQTTYIIPLALPISSLLSSIILFQRLSRSGELTSLRASGMSLIHICKPLLAITFLLGIGNLYLASELGTQSHLLTRKMENDFLSMNPFLLLKNNTILKLKGVFIDTDQVDVNKDGVTNLNIAVYSDRHQRINILNAPSITLKDSSFLGKHISLINSLSSNKNNDFDQLIIENQLSMNSPQADLSLIMQRAKWKIKPDYLPLPLLLASIEHTKKMLSQTENTQKKVTFTKVINKSYGDIFRRFSLGLSVITFTLLGFAFGIDIGRMVKKSQSIWACLLAVTFLVSFMLGRSIDSSLFLIITLYLAPHLLISGASFWKLHRVNLGIE
jgi:lipopolysaccharide export system permease protein